ncbi:unnamed protein product [Ixodes hexagonus]
MNNAVYGKTMENMRNRQLIELASDLKKLEKFVSKVNFKLRKMFNKDLVALSFHKRKIFANKPVYVRMSVLDFPKATHYKDTDSLKYDIQTEDIYNDMRDMREYFDTSDCPRDHE